MSCIYRILTLGLLVMLAGILPARAVELRVSRGSIDRTLRQQLFSGQYGRYYIKGNAQSPCYTYAEQPQIVFANGRIAVQLMIHAKVGKTFGSKCFGFTFDLPTVVSVAPDAQGESVGFRDARLDRITDQKELNFILMPFLSHQVPSSMRVNAADLLRKALANSTASSGYQISLDKLAIKNIDVQGDFIVIEADGNISVQ
ncbi:MAG: hypothetical protein P4K83_03230 [Terracidiphilus sp.]|nr:hypothetical protein [Terracidiphilus sp.]